MDQEQGIRQLFFAVIGIGSLLPSAKTAIKATPSLLVCFHVWHVEALPLNIILGEWGGGGRVTFLTTGKEVVFFNCFVPWSMESIRTRDREGGGDGTVSSSSPLSSTMVSPASMKVKETETKLYMIDTKMLYITLKLITRWQDLLKTILQNLSKY